MSTLCPAPGSICRVRPHRVGVLPALVLVVAHPTATITRVRLLTNEVEMATDVDRVLPADPAARPYDLLVHEFPGYVRTADLDPPMSVIDPDRDLHPACALELTGPHDVRWAWKLHELQRLQDLQPPLSEVLGEP